MNESLRTRTFDVTQADDSEPSASADAGEITPWISVPGVRDDIDIQQADDQALIKDNPKFVGDVDSWIRIGTEITRCSITCTVLVLIVIWVIIGICIFLIEKNPWVLLIPASPALIPFIKGISSYYYPSSLKKSTRWKK